METMYLVSYFRHNKVSGGNAYKTELATTNLADAKKKYHALLGEFIEGEQYDFVSVRLDDMYGNKIMGEYWAEPQPEPEPQPEV